MSPQKTAQYQAYSVATRTVAKTRQIVMLYDGAIRFVKQAQIAIAEKRIEDRFRLLKRAADVIVGLQSSIDFENGGEIAQTLNRFYTDLSIRILSVNVNRKNGQELCENIVEDLKQMRDVWDNIDRNLTAEDSAADSAVPPSTNNASSGGSIAVSA
jgi:flagellar protein FliS